MLETGPVVLKSLGEDELDQTRAWANAPELQRLILRSGQVAPEDQRLWFERLRADKTRLVFAVFEHGRHVGNTGFYHIDSTHERAEFWILLGRDGSRGRGLGKAVLGLMLEHGFGALGLNKIFLHVGEGNLPAKRLYERFGFRQEALLREHYLIEGARVNVLGMSLLRSEYHGEK
ncbi:MAG: GNAT family protein [Humidesulfovibrio sp.]|jgi:RimJ/RimL family protein N-acetyltransferase|uniref:GNAT family N-acetyltransferase n=1 Tax=Humidesulfovibrio sp. TaxID=2910988 RepID=UPI002733380A|nr:GNAT family protein [Humidesulfovibrio sp.]MDP2848546.1 GNAT family protein [Humidesulfovibrio sp.]